MNDLSHDQAQELFSDRYEGTLAPERDAELAAHLAGCEPCRTEQVAFEDAMKAVKSASVSKRAPRPPDKEEFTERVERTLERRSDGRFFGPRGFGGKVPLALISLLMLAITLAVYLIAKRSTTGSLKEPIQRHAPGGSVPDDLRKQLPRP
jgi:anti-sigma factor RsiW